MLTQDSPPISGEEPHREAETQSLLPHSTTMDEEDLIWEEETQVLWPHLMPTDTSFQPHKGEKAQQGLSNISMCTIVPSRKSIITADTGHSKSIRNDGDMLYHPFSFEDLLFASEVYMRNQICPNVCPQYQPARLGRAIEARSPS